MTRRLRETYHRIGELLVRRKAVRPEDVDEALALQRAEIEQGKTPPRLGEILVERKVLDRLTIREILEEQKLGRGEKRTLKISLRDVHGVAVVGLDGRLEEKTAPLLIRVMERLMNRGFARVVVDSRNLIALTSAGLSGFIAYIDESRARGGDVKFFGLNANPRIVFTRMGLLQFIQIFGAELEAVAAFNLPIDEYMSRGALGEYVSGQDTRQFHLSYCAVAQKLTEDDRVYYESKWHAREEHKTACSKCRP